MRKERIRISRRAAWAASALCLLLAAGVCRAGDSPYWAPIRRADARVRSSQVSWRVLITVKPSHTMDHEQREKRVSDFEEQAQRKGEHAGDIAAGKAALRESLQMVHDGYSDPERVEFKDDGRVTRCEIISGDLAGPSVPKADPNTRAHVVEIYDGTNSITLAGVGAETPRSGSLTRGQRPLQHANVAYGELVVLAGAPITRFFSPADTTITEGARGVIVLEKHPQGNSMPFVRLLVSKATWRPVGMAWVSPFTRNLLSTCTITSYRNVGGVVLPSVFSVNQTTQLGVVLTTSEYHLVRAAFNENADVSELKSVVPAGTSLDDFRFGYSAPQYQVGDHIPTDAEVRLTIAHFGAQDAPSRTRSARVRVLLALGALLLAPGFSLLTCRYGAARRMT